MYDPRIVDAFLDEHAAEKGVGEGSPSAASSEPVAEAVPHGHPATADVAFHAFFELGRALGRRRAPVDEVGDTLWSHLRAHLPAAAFVLYVYDADRHALVPGYCSEAGLVAPDACVALGERLSGWVGATGHAMVNADARLDLDDRSPDGPVLRSALVVATRERGRDLAVLAFYAREADAFTETHRHLAEAAAHVLGSIDTSAAARLVIAA
jgi:GAF domain-containing protein